MAVGAEHVDGLRRRDEIEVVTRRRAVLFELRFVVAPALDPVFRTLAGIGVLLERLDHFGNAVHERNRAGNGVDRACDIRRMRVRINEARNHGLALKVDRTLFLGRILEVADPGELAVCDAESVHKAVFVLTGEDLAVVVKLFHFFHTPIIRFAICCGRLRVVPLSGEPPDASTAASVCCLSGRQRRLPWRSRRR